MNNHIELISLSDYTDFELIKSTLRSSEIEHVERDAMIGSMNRGFILSHEQPRILVHKNDYEQAKIILKEMGYDENEQDLSNSIFSSIKKVIEQIPLINQLRPELQTIAVFFLCFILFLILFLPIVWLLNT